MKIIKLLMMLGLIHSLSACSSSSDGNSSSRHFTDEQLAQDVFNRSTIDCENGDCPASVGGLYSFTRKSSGYNVGSCSLTLISHNMILTNHHCLPKGITTTGSACANRIRIIFPATNEHSLEQYECDKVVKAAIEYPKTAGPDWAIIQFSGSTNRQPVALNSGGIANSQDTVLHPVYFDLNVSARSRGTVRKVTCKANHNMMYSDDFTGPLGALFNVSNCTRDLISGNSGTGLKNTSGELIGVYSFGPTDKSIKRLKRTYTYLSENFGGGTNLHCIEALTGVTYSECAYDYKGKIYHSIARLNTYGLSIIKDSNFSNATARSLISAENDTNINSKMKLTITSPSLRQNFSISAYESDFIATKAQAKDLWLEILFPTLPTCMDKSMGKTGWFDLPVRSPRDQKNLSDYEYIMTRESSVQSHTFKFIRKNDHYVIYPHGAPSSKSDLKMIFTIKSWEDLKFKVNFCN